MMIPLVALLLAAAPVPPTAVAQGCHPEWKTCAVFEWKYAIEQPHLSWIYPRPEDIQASRAFAMFSFTLVGTDVVANGDPKRLLGTVDTPVQGAPGQVFARELVYRDGVVPTTMTETSAVRADVGRLLWRSTVARTQQRQALSFNGFGTEGFSDEVPIGDQADLTTYLSAPAAWLVAAVLLAMVLFAARKPLARSPAALNTMLLVLAPLLYAAANRFYLAPRDRDPNDDPTFWLAFALGLGAAMAVGVALLVWVATRKASRPRPFVRTAAWLFILASPIATFMAELVMEIFHGMGHM